MGVKETRQYGLFEKVDGKWIRLCPGISFKKTVAVRVFQNALISGIELGKHMGLRPLK